MYPFADIRAIPNRQVEDVTAEIITFNAAINAVKKDMNELGTRLHDKLPAEERALFDVYSLMLDSESFTGVTRSRIEAGNWAPGALRETIEEHERFRLEEADRAVFLAALEEPPAPNEALKRVAGEYRRRKRD